MVTLENYAAMVNEAIAHLKLPKQPAGLYEPIRYALSQGGKRIRPVFTLAAAQSLGIAPEKAMPQALGVEMYHNFTLLHDDVMDNSDTRHGRPTVHRQWNLPTAILSGDAMLTLASVLVGDNAPRSVVENFNQAALEVYEGQQYDMDFESRDDVTVQEYLMMISKKTGALLGAACQIGALRAGADEETAARFYQFGMNYGMAFQLRDDYLDTFGDAVTFGKPIGGDILNEKKTWLWIRAMEQGQLSAIFDQGLRGQEKIDAVRAEYQRLGLDNDIERHIQRYIDAAQESIASLPISPEFAAFFTAMAASSALRKK
ncbi:MAG: polyprenyl synthetase family protein [Bacteroidales bacterium]|nr:polyprenyl synthetase family protein [Bacteroidales bacterium]